MYIYICSFNYVILPFLTLPFQLIADKEASCNVNQTVLVSHVFSLSHRVALFFNSPFPPSQQATEWAEFFQPALQDCLLPYFLKRASELDYMYMYTCRPLNYFQILRLLEARGWIKALFKRKTYCIGPVTCIPLIIILLLKLMYSTVVVHCVYLYAELKPNLNSLFTD